MSMSVTCSQARPCLCTRYKQGHVRVGGGYVGWSDQSLPLDTGVNLHAGDTITATQDLTGFQMRPESPIGVQVVTTLPSAMRFRDDPYVCGEAVWVLNYSLLRTRRRVLHNAAAQALAVKAEPETLVYHHTAAGNTDEAIHAWPGRREGFAARRTGRSLGSLRESSGVAVRDSGFRFAGSA